MKNKLKNRRSIRLRGFDYAQNGWYFITICIQGFEELLGQITNDGIFEPNELEKIAEASWNETATIRPEVELDVFQIMPNHFHFIVVIGPKTELPEIVGFPNTDAEPATFKSPVKTVGSIVRGFKGSSTKQMRLIDPLLGEKVWQTNYYERIIRDEDELNRIRDYIENNPAKWQEDKEFFKKLLAKMKKR